MKQVHGFWFPDYDTHFPRMLDKSLKNDGVVRYQWRARELAIAESTPRRICIDIGANVGLWSCELVEHFDQVIALVNFLNKLQFQSPPSIYKETFEPQQKPLLPGRLFLAFL